MAKDKDAVRGSQEDVTTSWTGNQRCLPLPLSLECMLCPSFPEGTIFKIAGLREQCVVYTI